MPEVIRFAKVPANDVLLSYKSPLAEVATSSHVECVCHALVEELQSGKVTHFAYGFDSPLACGIFQSLDERQTYVGSQALYYVKLPATYDGNVCLIGNDAGKFLQGG